jgi:hypothetical protein
MIIEYSEMWSKPTTQVSYTDKFRKLTIKLQKAYQVVTSPDETEYGVLQGTDLQGNRLPTAGSPFSLDFPFCYAEIASIERPSPILWLVTVDYNGELGPIEGENQNNPLFAPPRIDWDDVESEHDVNEDFDGNPIVNLTGEAIEGVKALIADQTVTIKRNMLTFSPYVQARYRRAVNSDSFLGWPPGTAKLMKLSASNVLGSELAYWEVTAQIQFRYPYRTTPENAWYARVRHEGYYEIIEVFDKDINGDPIPGTGRLKKVRAVDDNKEPEVKPVLLDEEGFRMPKAAQGQPQPAHYLEFKLYDTLPYSALGLI